MLAYRNPSDRIPKGFRNTPKLCAYEKRMRSDRIVIYNTQPGFTKKYAEWLSEALECECVECSWAEKMKLFVSALKAKKDKTEKEQMMADMISKSYDISDRKYIEPIVAWAKGE